MAMQSQIGLLMAAVESQINAGTYTIGAITTELSWVPSIKLVDVPDPADSEVPLVIIRGAAWNWNVGSRAGLNRSYGIDVAVLGRIDQEDVESPDRYAQLLEEIGDELAKPDNRQPVTGIRFTGIGPTSPTEPMSTDANREKNTYIGVITPAYEYLAS